jgi:aspartate aminotransferase
MISMLLAVLQGAVIIPTPSWVSYLPQAKILKKEVISLRTRSEDNFKLTPELLKDGLKGSQASQKILIFNHPNNPTGAVYSESELKELAEVCRRCGVVVISDEIYALTSFEPEKFVSMGKIYPQGTIVTGGLSKDRSSGGYRLGVGIFPKEPPELIRDVLKVAGSTYSCVAAPVQYAALTAYSPDNRIEEYMNDCRKINALAGLKMSSLLAAVPGVKTTTPQGGFYLYADFNEQREQFLQVGLKTCREFCEHLIAAAHTALLPGESAAAGR